MRTIAQLFDERGENGFRELERNMLHEVAEINDVVVACGGGTPCFYDNVDYMNLQGTTVFLEASEECLFSRLSRFRNKRPLIKDLDDASLREFIRSNLARRISFYSKAAYTFCGENLEDAHQIDTSVDRFVDKFGLNKNN